MKIRLDNSNDTLQVDQLVHTLPNGLHKDFAFEAEYTQFGTELRVSASTFENLNQLKHIKIIDYGRIRERIEISTLIDSDPVSIESGTAFYPIHEFYVLTK